MRQVSYIILLFSVVISCNNNSENYNLYPDSINYKYYPLKDNLLKVVRFYPDTKDTSVIYFLNVFSGYKDSITYYFDKQGKITDKIKYKDNMNIRKCKKYYKTGNIKQEFTIKGKHKIGNVKSYYSSGKLKSIKEIVVYKDSIEYLNNFRYYNDNGEINIDSTIYVEMLCPKDTISINDSIKIEFNVIKPEYIGAFALVGSIDKYFFTNRLSEDDLIKSKIYFYNPKQIGLNYIEVVFIFKYFGIQKFYKSFLKKEIYVTE